MKHYSSFIRVFSTVLLGSATFLSGCYFKAPSISEQSALVQRGAFPRGVPAWTSSAMQASASGFRKPTGLIPQGFGATSRPTPIKSSRENPAESLGGSKNPSSAGSADTALENNRKEKSELDRITSKCANSEGDVTDALTTLDRTERIKKYRRLTNTCPESYDIWLWLARDFYAENRLAEATRAANQVLLLDSGNPHAAGLLQQIRSTRDDTP